jgi:hypothetical protein
MREDAIVHNDATIHEMPEPRDLTGNGPFANFEIDESDFERRFAYAVAIYAERLTQDNPTFRGRLQAAREAAAGWLAWIRKLESPEREVKLERAITQLWKELHGSRLWHREQALRLRHEVEGASSLIARYGRSQRGTSREGRPASRRTRTAASQRGDPDEPEPPDLVGRLLREIAGLLNGGLW